MKNPSNIRKTLSKYISKNKLFNIGKRDLAIKKAIQNAQPQETILIAGKGHETQQIYKNKLYNISDKGIIKKINKKFKNINNEKQNYLQNRSLLNEILGKSKTNYI